MGKNFENELDNLTCIYESSMNADIQVLIDFFKKYYRNNFIGIGSGGSYSVAELFKYLCIKAGWKAQALTPLELSQLDCQLYESVMVLFTAGGRNRDSRNAYQYIAEHEPTGVLTCCMRINSVIKKEQKNNIHNYFYEHEMPVKKDGYLAVESLISSIVILIRAFESITKKDFFKLSKDRGWKKFNLTNEILDPILERETIIVLHGGITTPIAIDMESKFCEVALGNVQLVDYRNFAHGRHYWISSRKNKTSIIALVGGNEIKIAEATLNLIPSDVPTLRIDIDDKTADGILDGYDFIFELVSKSGEYRGVNPGKPHVEQFGKKLYHLNHNICKNKHMVDRRKSTVQIAAYRKACASKAYMVDEYVEYAKKYLSLLQRQIFKGIIFDYDGTLHDKNKNTLLEKEIFKKINYFLSEGIKIGIATGRGKSVRLELQKVIDKCYWDELFIAYYNGGIVSSLSDDKQPDKLAIAFPASFVEISQYIQEQDLYNGIYIDGIEDKNPYQLTIIEKESRNSRLSLLKERLSHFHGVKIMESSHSIDIVPCEISKNNIFKVFDDLGYKKEEFLVIGDSGQLGGNDYELLCNKNSLSVDCVSNAIDSCWNFAEPAKRNLEATEFYLGHIEIIDKSFRIKV